MRLFPKLADRASRDRSRQGVRLVDLLGAERLAAEDWVACGNEIDQWICPEDLGFHVCELRSLGVAWTGISHDCNGVPIYALMTWLLTHRLSTRHLCVWCRPSPHRPASL